MLRIHNFLHETDSGCSMLGGKNFGRRVLQASLRHHSVKLLFVLFPVSLGSKNRETRAYFINSASE